MVRYHFSGVAGAGMSPLAQLMRARGHAVQGSDRALDQGKSGEVGIEEIARVAQLDTLLHVQRANVFRQKTLL